MHTMKYTASINDVSFGFDFARISNDGTMSIEFIADTRHKSCKPAQLAKMRKDHPDYSQTLAELKEARALAPIVIYKGA